MSTLIENKFTYCKNKKNNYNKNMQLLSIFSLISFHQDQIESSSIHQYKTEDNEKLLSKSSKQEKVKSLYCLWAKTTNELEVLLDKNKTSIIINNTTLTNNKKAINYINSLCKKKLLYFLSSDVKSNSYSLFFDKELTISLSETINTYLNNLKEEMPIINNLTPIYPSVETNQSTNQTLNLKELEQDTDLMEDSFTIKPLYDLVSKTPLGENVKSLKF